MATARWSLEEISKLIAFGQAERNRWEAISSHADARESTYAIDAIVQQDGYILRSLTIVKSLIAKLVAK